MGSIIINSNLAALNAQRRLSQSTASLQESFTRLSSGLRINRASDDASGLAIAAGLKVDARVFNQGVRNFSDAVGMFNVAEGATRELSNILLRQRELATQAANGTLSFDQRAALNEEANALVEEYNRIIDSTKFNDLSLIDGSLSELRVQGGFGDLGGILVSLGEALSRVVGDGTFEDPVAYGASLPAGITTFDFDGDGDLDIANAKVTFGAHWIGILLNNGDGTFSAEVTYEAAVLTTDLRVGDFDGDGKVDIASSYNAVTRVLLGNGDGSFRTAVYTPHAGVLVSDLEIGDFNSDGILDLLVAHQGTGIALMIGNGDGTFLSPVTFAGGASVQGVSVADIDHDGNLDVLASDTGANTAQLFLGDGGGGFSNPTAIGLGSTQGDLQLEDVNGDGIADLVGSLIATQTTVVRLGNGDGSFDAIATYAGLSNLSKTELFDVNGDGLLDIVTGTTTGTGQIMFGNGDGTFGGIRSFTAGTDNADVAIADVDGDGAGDLITSNRTDSIFVSISNGVSTNLNPSLRLFTREEALEAMDTIDGELERVLSELGEIGATQSRMQTAQLVRAQILQQAGAAILGQANQSPQLALALIS